MRKKPNIIYILADDMGYGDISYLNKDSKINTVCLDQLASEGIVFRDAHSSSAVSTPSRYSILTGRYNWRSWLKEGVTFGYDKGLIEPGRVTVPSLLRENGYKTACIGKWHLGWSWTKNGEEESDVDFQQPIKDGPISHGFDYFYGLSASLDMPPYVYVENDMVTAVPDRIIPASTGKGFWREGPIAPDFKHENVLSNLTEKSLSWIEDCSKEESPFFLYFSLTAPHTPILPDPKFQGKSGTNEYGDFCQHIDDIVGQVMSKLKSLGIEDETILIFTSDNGCSPMADFKELDAVGHKPSYIFRGHKADIYEGGHRIPLLIRWPERIKPGRACDETVCLVDLLATCADILDVKLPDNAGEDSVSNLPLWEGKEFDISLREATVHHSIDGSFSIRKGRWKLEMCPGSGGWSYPASEEDCEGLPDIQLYDLEADIGETSNVYSDHDEVIEELKSLLTSYIKNGRSTPGEIQHNFGDITWKQLWWMLSRTPDNIVESTVSNDLKCH